LKPDVTTVPKFRDDRNELSNRLVVSQNQTGSGMYHPIVKEQVIPGQLEGHPDKRLLYPTASKSQPLFLSFSAGVIRDSAISEW